MHTDRGGLRSGCVDALHPAGPISAAEMKDVMADGCTRVIALVAMGGCDRCDGRGECTMDATDAPGCAARQQQQQHGELAATVGSRAPWPAACSERQSRGS